MPISSLPQSPLSKEYGKQQEDEDDSSIIRWWLHLTSPNPNNPRRTQNIWREEVTSLLFPLVFVNVLLAMFATLSNPRQLIILSVVFVIDVIALFLKRAGFMTIAGLIVMTTTELGLCASILSLGNHFDSVNLPLYDDMIQASLLSMAFFPPLIGFLIVLINISFIVFTLVNMPHAADLSQHLSANIMSVITSPLSLQILTTAMAYVIINVLIKAIRRADKAEKLATLESQIIEQQHKEIQLKEQLDLGMTQILSTLNEAANGNFSTRAPLGQDNALWRIGYSINNLLARLQGFKSEKAELEKTRQIAVQIATKLKTGQRITMENWTGTCIDLIIVELMRSTPSSSPANQIPPHPTFPIKPTRLNGPRTRQE